MGHHRRRRCRFSPFYILSPVFPAATGSGRLESDDIVREICRHCATAELREGNTVLPLTSPCYIAIRSLFTHQFPLYVDSPTPAHPLVHHLGVSFWRTSQFALPSRRNYNSSKCLTLHGFRPKSGNYLHSERREESAVGERTSKLLEIGDDFALLRRPNLDERAIFFPRPTTSFSRAHLHIHMFRGACARTCGNRTKSLYSQISSSVRDGDAAYCKTLRMKARFSVRVLFKLRCTIGLYRELHSNSNFS